MTVLSGFSRFALSIQIALLFLCLTSMPSNAPNTLETRGHTKLEILYRVLNLCTGMLAG